MDQESVFDSCDSNTSVTVLPDPPDPSQETSTLPIGSGSVTQFLNGSSRSPPIRSDPVVGIEEAIWGSLLPVQPLPLFTLPKTGANLYVRAELELLPNDVKVDLTQPPSGETFADSDEITISATASGDPELTFLAGVDLTLRDGSVEEVSCPVDSSNSASTKASFVVQPNVPPECRCAAALPRGGLIQPTILDGTSRKGWIHIEARHITGTNPGGDLFAAGTTRAELETAAKNLVNSGTRISNPESILQIFEDRIIVHGMRDIVRVVVDSNDCSVITIFPVRSE